MRRLIFALSIALLVQPAAALDVPFVPTPEKVVEGMLALAKAGPRDTVYDLGSGDGRIVITAAKQHGARGVGIDIDPERVREARDNARKANVFHMGDLFFSAGYPFIDLGSGGSVEGIISAAEKVLALANDSSKIIPGHGPLATKKDLTAYRDTMKEIRNRVQSQIKAGKSLEEVIAAKPTKEWDEKLGQGFIKGDQITEFVYRSLSKK